MKKILALVLALCMIFALAACGGQTEEPAESLPTPAAEAPAEAPAEEPLSPPRKPLPPKRPLSPPTTSATR